MIPGIRPTRSLNTTGRGNPQNAKRTGERVKQPVRLARSSNDDHGKSPCQLGNLTKLY